MTAKTRLEFDIEHRERYRTPVSIKTLIVLMVFILCFISVYTYKLKQELVQIEQEAVVMKADFNKKKVELLRQIKQLQAKRSSARPDIN